MLWFLRLQRTSQSLQSNIVNEILGVRHLVALASRQKRQLIRTRIAAVLFLSCAAISSEVEGASIVALGTLPGYEDAYYTVLGISGNGSVVIGDCKPPSSSSPSVTFRWTPAGGMQPWIVSDPAWTSVTPSAVSADGAWIVGSGVYLGSSRAFRWSASTGMQSLGVLPGFLGSYSAAVSSNGSVVVGNCSNTAAARAFRWTSSAGMQDIGVMTGYSSSDAWDVSSDGSTTVGNLIPTSGLSYVAFRHTASGGLQSLGIPLGFFATYGYSVNANGSVIVGTASTTAVGFAFRWRSGVGMELISRPGGTSGASGVSGDGATVTGNIGSWYGSTEGAVWTATMGLFPLSTYLLNRGVDLSNWGGGSGGRLKIDQALKISSDGAFVAGNSQQPGGRYRAFVIDLRGGCVGDFNRDSRIDGADLGILLGDWGKSGVLATDLNGDGVVNGSDLGTLLPYLQTTCP